MGAIIEIIQNIKRLCQEKGAIIEEKNPKYHNIISGNGGNVGGCWKSKQTWQWGLSRTSSLCDFKIMMMMLMINDHDHEIIIRM